MLKLGGQIVFVDARGQLHDALITAIWGEPKDLPCINVVFVSTDNAKQDQYGRQIERETSIVYKEKQSAHGMYYMFHGETPNPYKPAIV